MNDFNNEIWKIIDGFEDYQISNYGRVKSLNYNKTKQERILKQATITNGYQQVNLYKDGKQKCFIVHRLVANAFIDNPNNYAEVNHKDECKTNNHVSNLEWCDRKYNCNFGTRNKKVSKALIGKYSGENNPMYGKLGKEHPNAKQVIQLTLNGDYIKLWDSMHDIERELGYSHGNIGKCCKGKQKTSNGYKWAYA